MYDSTLNFGQRVNFVLLLRGLKSSDIVDRMPVDQSLVYRIIRGDRPAPKRIDFYDVLSGIKEFTEHDFRYLIEAPDVPEFILKRFTTNFKFDPSGSGDSWIALSFIFSKMQKLSECRERILSFRADFAKLFPNSSSLKTFDESIAVFEKEIRELSLQIPELVNESMEQE